MSAPRLDMVMRAFIKASCREYSRAALLQVLLAAFLFAACSDSPDSREAGPGANGEWRTFGGGLQRRSYNPSETRINRESVRRLIPRWRFVTNAIVAAAPIVANVELPGEGDAKVVFAPSWDGFFYALRARDGTLIWRHRFKPQPGAEFVGAASASVEDVDGRRLVYVSNGETMYCFVAATGELVWEFDAGTGCTTCDRYNERNEVLSPSAVHEGVVYFGMDVNESPAGKGGVYAVDAQTGVLRWYYDLQTESTCRPGAGDRVRRFDGFHTAERLGLPQDFFASRQGCGFSREPDGCGGVYGGAAIDASRRLLYFASTNCNPDPENPRPAPRLDEAIVTLTFEGELVWSWRPREIDPLDVDFGSTPNLFTIELGGETREVVGVGGKDGTYYVLDRDGVSEVTGRIEPYWQRNVVPGGAAGGIIQSQAVANDVVLFSTAFGDDDNGPEDFQRPAAWGLNANDGSVRWSVPEALASFSPTSAIPGIAFMGSFAGTLFAYDTDSGAELARFDALGPLFSQAVAVDGALYVGAGSGARVSAPEDIAHVVSWLRSPISAFCIAGSEDCPDTGACIDANPCTRDRLLPGGECNHELEPDGSPCSVGGEPGQCQGGDCDTPALDCDDRNVCTQDMRTPKGCRYASEPEGTPCLIGGERPDTCHEGACGREPGRGSRPF